MIDNETIKNVFAHYLIKGEIIKVIPFGEGHINSTYLVTFREDKNEINYILQLINDAIFHPVEMLMKNFLLVTKHCQKKIKEQGGDPHRETLNVILTKENKPFVVVENKYYRVLEYIDNTTALQIIKNPIDFFYSAVAFANFYKMLEDFDASQLYEIIPNFHNTIKRLNDFKKAVKEDKLGRKKTCEKEIQFILDREKYCGLIVEQLKSGELPLRVTHNDTKLNNVLFDNNTNRPIAVIDLDTIMPGSLCYDFGDAIRFGCNSANEDEPDLSKVCFRLDLYSTFINGFLITLGDKITRKEKDMLAMGSILMTLECGMRFLADYLEGDHYFHTKYDNHNLIRCRTQLKLVEGMEENYKTMNTLAI